MACQHNWDYFIPRDSEIAYTYIYTFFLYSFLSFFVLFFEQLYDIRNLYLIQIIHKHIYLTHTLTGTTTPRQSTPHSSEL